MAWDVEYGFAGKFDTTVDVKGRLLVQVAFRKKLVPERDGEGLRLVISADSRIWLYPQNYYFAVVIPEAEAQVTSNQDWEAFEQIYYSLSASCELDAQGRIILPDEMVQQTKTATDVVVVGKDDHIEVWNKSDWDERVKSLEEARKRLAPIPRRSRRMMTLDSVRSTPNQP